MWPIVLLERDRRNIERGRKSQQRCGAGVAMHSLPVACLPDRLTARSPVRVGWWVIVSGGSTEEGEEDFVTRAYSGGRGE